MAKSNLEDQLGVFNPTDLPEGEGLVAAAGTRNADGTLAQGKASVASLGQESVVSLPNDAKIQAEIDKLVESEEEDGEFVDKIEGAQNTRLQAEKDDNN